MKKELEAKVKDLLESIACGVYDVPLRLTDEVRCLLNKIARDEILDKLNEVINYFVRYDNSRDSFITAFEKDDKLGVIYCLNWNPYLDKKWFNENYEDWDTIISIIYVEVIGRKEDKEAENGSTNKC